jgi:hypothetical protein
MSEGENVVRGKNRKDLKVREMREGRECCERKESQGLKNKEDERRERML